MTGAAAWKPNVGLQSAEAKFSLSARGGEGVSAGAVSSGDLNVSIFSQNVGCIAVVTIKLSVLTVDAVTASIAVRDGDGGSCDTNGTLPKAT